VLKAEVVKWGKGESGVPSKHRGDAGLGERIEVLLGQKIEGKRETFSSRGRFAPRCQERRDKSNIKKSDSRLKNSQGCDIRSLEKKRGIVKKFTSIRSERF